MRLILSLSALLLLAGAGCATTPDGDDIRRVETETPATNILVSTGTNMIASDVQIVTPTTTKKSIPSPKTARDDENEDGNKEEDDERSDDKANIKTTPAVTPTQPTVTGYTMADVRTQAAAGKCWSVIDGKVYDLSSWINKHPGGAGAIKSLCGIDGTAKFQAVHGGQANPERVLAGFGLGTLK